MEDNQQFHEDLPVCPSFSSYSTSKFADIADKVAKEVNRDDEVLSIDDDDSDLDFSFVRCDEGIIIRRDAEFTHAFPIFNSDLPIRVNKESDISTLNVSLKKLFLDEDEEHDPPSSSSSSSETDELETIPPESYCVWKPKEVEASPITCKKSRSTGSGSKRWKLRDLLYNRSNSDGKSAFIFLKEKQKSSKVEMISDQRLKQVKEEKRVPSSSSSSSPAASYMQLIYTRNRAIKESEKRKTYLPYKRDLVGFYTTVNGIGRGFPAF
ncbi:uncharacterized protein LOC124922122 [Impatiens glandulifera]|uniref:uncharacterized protein LOC124922122 n=1 Tax=Impatiens glandulifera TaxID=253017 RepID=UPI001FB0F246|nr:uncharacterized protein LOC124922122 [Impatiens glandulifera]